MENQLRQLHESIIESGDMSTPYTCLHIVILRPQSNQSAFDLHMLHEGVHVMHTLDPDSPFQGHPLCYCCNGARLRFLLGTEGNLIQKWSNAQYTVQDLHLANLYSDGQLMVRSVLPNPVNQIEPREPRATAALVRNIETHIWKRQMYPSNGGPRKLILAPYSGLIRAVRDAMKEAVCCLKPFIYLSIVDLYFRFLPEENNDDGQVRVQWAPITVNPTDVTRFGLMMVEGHLTLNEFVSRFVANPQLRVTCLHPHNGQNNITPWDEFPVTQFCDIYYQLQQGIGGGSIPFEPFPDGTLRYPIFQIHLLPEPVSQWRRIG